MKIVSRLALASLLLFAVNCAPDRRHHDESWKENILNILHQKNITLRRTTTTTQSPHGNSNPDTELPLAGDISDNVQQSDSVSGVTLDDDIVTVQQHGVYGRDSYQVYYEPNFALIYGIVAAVIVGSCVFIACCVACCIRAGCCKREVKGFVVRNNFPNGPMGPPSPSHMQMPQAAGMPPHEPVVMQHSPPPPYDTQQLPWNPEEEKSPHQPPWNPAAENNQHQLTGIENPGFYAASAPPPYEDPSRRY